MIHISYPRGLVADTVKREYGKIVPEAVTLEELNIKGASRFSLHAVTSPRFICTLRVSTDYNQQLEIKTFVKNRGNVLQEFENMRLLWQAHYSRREKYQIPEPLHVDEKHGLLFLKYWPGESFLSSFYRWADRGQQSRRSTAAEYAECAAQWLVDFQDIYSSEEEKGVPPELLNFDAQVATATPFTPAIRQRIIDKMRGLQESLPRLRDTCVHDQYLFRNILYKCGKTCVVDFPHFRMGWPLYDFLTFYTGIERLKQYPLFSAATAELMKNVFAQTYFAGKGGCYDAEELENLWAFFIVAYISGRYRNKNLGKIRKIVNNIFIRNMLSKVVTWSQK